MAEKKVIALMGSPLKNGNTMLLTEHLMRSVQESGAETEIIFLHGLDIHCCDSCDFCQRSGKNECKIKDDMQLIYQKLLNANAIVFATPVYWFSVSAQLKACIDRLYALDTKDGNLLNKKQFGVVLVYGDSDPYTSGAINVIRSFQDMMRYMGAPLIGIAYGSAENPGDILQNNDGLEAASGLGRKLGTGLV